MQTPSLHTYGMNDIDRIVYYVDDCTIYLCVN